jgi:hypothetical protein
MVTQQDLKLDPDAYQNVTDPEHCLKHGTNCRVSHSYQISANYFS